MTPDQQARAAILKDAVFYRCKHVLSCPCGQHEGFCVFLEHHHGAHAALFDCHVPTPSTPAELDAEVGMLLGQCDALFEQQYGPAIRAGADLRAGQAVTIRDGLAYPAWPETTLATLEDGRLVPEEEREG